MAQLLGVVIVEKNSVDTIAFSNGGFGEQVQCIEEGSPRRCGGQGDVLTGIIATFLAWGDGVSKSEWGHDELGVEVGLACAYAACYMTRAVAKRSFRRRGRGMIASDLLEDISATFVDCFEKT